MEFQNNYSDCYFMHHLCLKLNSGHKKMDFLNSYKGYKSTVWAPNLGKRRCYLVRTNDIITVLHKGCTERRAVGGTQVVYLLHH